MQLAEVKVKSSQIRSQKSNTIYFLGYKQAASSLAVVVLIVHVLSWQCVSDSAMQPVLQQLRALNSVSTKLRSLL
jgi:hypothetical protein